MQALQLRWAMGLKGLRNDRYCNCRAESTIDIPICHIETVLNALDIGTMNQYILRALYIK
jgi:hypothetical protein